MERPGARVLSKYVSLGMLFLAVCVMVTITLVHRPDQPDTTSAPLTSATTEIESPTAEEITALGPGSNVVFVGDSYTAALGSETGGYVELLAGLNEWNYTNLGQGGTGYVTSPFDPNSACGNDDCLNYQDTIPLVEREDPDIVVVFGGRNDLAASSVEVAETIPAFYAELRRVLPDAAIIAVSPIWDARDRPRALDLLADLIRESSENVGGHYVEIGDPLLGRRDLVTSDNVHPNDAGYAAIADAIQAGIQQIRAGVGG